MKEPSEEAKAALIEQLAQGKTMLQAFKGVTPRYRYERTARSDWTRVQYAGSKQADKERRALWHWVTTTFIEHVS